MVKQLSYYRKQAGFNNSDGLTPKMRQFCTEYLTNGFDSTKAATVCGYSNPQKAGYLTLNRKSIQTHLAKYIRKMERDLNIDFQWKVNKIAKLVNEGIPENGPIDSPVMARLALDGIAELNKMQGDLAPTKAINANVNAEVEIDREELRKLIEKYDREY